MLSAAKMCRMQQKCAGFLSCSEKSTAVSVARVYFECWPVHGCTSSLVLQPRFPPTTFEASPVVIMDN